MSWARCLRTATTVRRRPSWPIMISRADDYPALVTYPGLPRRIRKVGAPIGVIILLGTVTGLIVIGLTAANPVGTGIGFALSSLAMTIVVLAYLWLDRWEPEPPRLLILAFLWEHPLRSSSRRSCS